MNPLKIILGFAPFVVFSVLSTIVGADWAAFAGLIAALVVVAATARGGIKIPPAAQGVILLAMTVLAFTGGRPVDAFLVKYGPGLAGTLLGLFLVATASTVPFTAQLARGSAPPEYWHNPEFLDVNRRVSTVWGLAVLVLGICHLAGAEIGVEGLQLGLRLAVNWLLPLFAFWRAGAYTKRTIAAAPHTNHAAHERTAP